MRARLRDRVLTESERRLSEVARRPVEVLALHLAIKEAAMKAIGTGLAKGVSWQDFEATRGPRGWSLVLSGRAEEIARARGSGRVWLATALTRTHAVAQVVLEQPGSP